jgi:hypothetical protein
MVARRETCRISKTVPPWQVMLRSLDASSANQLTRVASGVYQYAPPFFSPDGGRVYFVASRSLWAVGAMGGEPREIIRGAVGTATLSPDGNTLAYWRYSEAGKGYSGVWISSPPGAPPREYEPAPFRVEGNFIPIVCAFHPTAPKSRTPDITRWKRAKCGSCRGRTGLGLGRSESSRNVL